jgi:hypothetical protein
MTTRKTKSKATADPPFDFAQSRLFGVDSKKNKATATADPPFDFAQGRLFGDDN